jgi:putative ABC transport system ATP-binding protein
VSFITVDHVTKAYGKKHNIFVALDNVSLEIAKGKSVAIIGKSGSGKSTLMHVISGLDRPDKGEILVDGQNILKLKSRLIDQFRAKSIGFIFQAFFVQANETCYQNVELPLEIGGISPRKRKSMIEEALREVELSDKINAKAGSLSGGQKQRLAIARAIVTKPQIIFADEPTGNLDSTTGQKIEDLLFSLNKSTGATLIIVTHDEELAARCEEQIYIKDGKIEKVLNKKVVRPLRRVI